MQMSTPYDLSVKLAYHTPNARIATYQNCGMYTTLPDCIQTSAMIAVRHGRDPDSLFHIRCA